MKKILSLLVLLSIAVPTLSFAKDGTSTREQRPPRPMMQFRASTTAERIENREKRIDERMERRENRLDNRLDRAGTTTMRFENRENNIERIRARLASTTASTSEKRIEKLNDRLEKQREQMGKVKERLLERETKVIESLTKIADKIAARIDILKDKGLDMTAASAKLDEANAKLVDLTTEADALSALVVTEVTEANKDQLFADIRTIQEKIRTLAKETHALLVDTVKEITKVLPQRPATTTATSTN